MDIIGQQYHVLKVLVISASASGAGYSGSYSELLTTRCSLRDNSGSRGIAFADTVGNSSWSIRCRYQDALWNAIAISMKFEIDGERYTLQSWSRVKDNRREYIQFNVTLERNG